MSKRIKHLILKCNEKSQHFFPHASKSLLCIRFEALTLRSEEEVLFAEDDLRDLFCSYPGSTLGGSDRKIITHVRNHVYLIPTKFHQNPSNGSCEEVENVKDKYHVNCTVSSNVLLDKGRVAEICKNSVFFYFIIRV